MFSFYICNIENLKSLDDNKLNDCCLNLESSLSQNNCSNINDIDLFSELWVFREIIHVKDDTMINILNYIINLDSFPNAYIAYRMMLTILVTTQ